MAMIPDPAATHEPDPLILIVDDTPTNIQVLAHVLMESYRIKFATNGPDALALANAPEKPDLILLDIMMPGMDGYEVCRRLRDHEETRNIPVIFVTAKNEVYDQEHGFHVGAVDYIGKPFELPIVRARVRTHISLKRRTELLERLAFLDGLTEIPNRRRLDEVLQMEWQRAIRNQVALALLMVDIDHFKAFNDHYGHSAGDECLCRIAHTLRAALLRPGDFIARYGGEEFTVLLPECDDRGAGKVAERLRASVEALGILHEYSQTSPRVTISVGYAVRVPAQNGEPALLLEAADQALYLSKQQGRNRVCMK